VVGENVALVSRLLSAWNSDEEIDLADFYDPEVEFIPLRAATEGEYRGLAGIEAFIRDTEEVFEDFKFDSHYEDLGERVLAWGTIHVRARESGLETDIPMGGLFEFSNGKIVRWEDFGSREKALEAARRAD
jgi:ketosteroid isomerase-like protein